MGTVNHSSALLSLAMIGCSTPLPSLAGIRYMAFSTLPSHILNFALAARPAIKLAVAVLKPANSTTSPDFVRVPNPALRYLTIIGCSTLPFSTVPSLAALSPGLATYYHTLDCYLLSHWTLSCPFKPKGKIWAHFEPPPSMFAPLPAHFTSS